MNNKVLFCLIAIFLIALVSVVCINVVHAENVTVNDNIVEVDKIVDDSCEIPDGYAVVDVNKDLESKPLVVKTYDGDRVYNTICNLNSKEKIVVSGVNSFSKVYCDNFRENCQGVIQGGNQIGVNGYYLNNGGSSGLHCYGANVIITDLKMGVNDGSNLYLKGVLLNYENIEYKYQTGTNPIYKTVTSKIPIYKTVYSYKKVTKVFKNCKGLYSKIKQVKRLMSSAYPSEMTNYQMMKAWKFYDKVYYKSGSFKVKIMGWDKSKGALAQCGHKMPIFKITVKYLKVKSSRKVISGYTNVSKKVYVGDTPVYDIYSKIGYVAHVY